MSVGEAIVFHGELAGVDDGQPVVAVDVAGQVIGENADGTCDLILHPRNHASFRMVGVARGATIGAFEAAARAAA